MKNVKCKAICSLLIMAVFSLFFSSCEEENPTPTSSPTPTPIVEAEVLDCNYFSQARTLVDKPNSAVDYIIDCVAYIKADIVIEPGVVIEFKNNAGLSIGDKGSLSAVGTEEKPIIFTGTDKVKGSWKGVLFDSDDVKNKLSYVTIDYAGGSAFNSNDNKAGLILWAGAKIGIDNCIFSNSATYGMELDYGNVTFTSFQNNTFTKNDVPVYTLVNYINDIDGTSSYSGNTKDYVEIGGTGNLKKGNHTWHKINVPYHIKSTGYGITRYVSIGDAVNVTIEAGTDIAFSSDTGLRVNKGGSLKAIGSSDDRITFRGVDAAAGAWKGLSFYFTQSVNNKISYANIKHTGSVNDGKKSAIYMWANPRLHVENSKFSDIEGCVYFDSFDNPNFSEANNDYTGIPEGMIYCPN